jgi:hypothetical protein
MQINPVRNDKFPAGDRGRWAIPKNPLGVHLLFITTCCGSAHPWVVFYFQTLLEGARARPQRPHFALACCQLSSTSSHECACCNCHAQLRRAPSDQQQPVCPTALGRRCNPRLCELYRPRERFARVGETSAPLTVALAIPSKQINQPHPTQPAHDCVRGAPAWSGCATRCSLCRSTWQQIIKEEACALRAISWCGAKPGGSHDCAVQSSGLVPCWLIAGLSSIDCVLTRPRDTTSTRREGRAYEDHQSVRYPHVCAGSGGEASPH